MESDGRLTPSEERALKILRDAPDQTSCLNALESLLRQYFDLDGYAINLLQPDANALLCVRVHMPMRLIGIEEAYANTSVPLNSEHLGARAFAGGIPIGITSSNVFEYPESTQKTFTTLGMKHMVFLPIQVGGHPIGVLTLFSQRSAIHPLTLRRITRVLEETAALLRLHQIIAGWDERAQAITSREAQLQSLLAFVAGLSHPASEAELYPRLLGEFLERFDLDLATILLKRENNGLYVADTLVRGTPHWAARWREHSKRIAYSLDLSDGASSIAFDYNQHLFFGDIPAARGLAMSDKDRANLDVLDDLQSFGIFPIRHQGQPIGLLWLGSSRRQHALSVEQLNSVQNLCDVLGTAIENARIYVQLLADLAAAKATR